MIHSIHVAISVILVLLHTSILNSALLYNLAFVTFLAFLMYLACCRTLQEGLLPVFLAGFLIDSFSGGPFGLFTSTYFWIFLVSRYAVQFLRLQNPHTIRLLILFGVVLENGILFSTRFIVDPTVRPNREIGYLLAGQMALAVLLGAVLFRGITRMIGAAESWRRAREPGASES